MWRRSSRQQFAEGLSRFTLPFGVPAAKTVSRLANSQAHLIKGVHVVRSVGRLRKKGYVS